MFFFLHDVKCIYQPIWPKEEYNHVHLFGGKLRHLLIACWLFLDCYCFYCFLGVGINFEFYENEEMLFTYEAMIYRLETLSNAHMLLFYRELINGILTI